MSEYNDPKHIKKLNEAWLKRKEKRKPRSLENHPWSKRQDYNLSYIDRIIEKTLGKNEEEN
jgi:hypothetical protein